MMMDDSTTTISPQSTRGSAVDQQRKTLVLVVVPCLNEAATIGQVVESVP